MAMTSAVNQTAIKMSNNGGARYFRYQRQFRSQVPSADVVELHANEQMLQVWSTEIRRSGYWRVLLWYPSVLRQYFYFFTTTIQFYYY